MDASLGVGRVDGRLPRTGPSLDVLGDVLEHHDGIVHHHTDGHGQGTEGYDVQRAVGQHQVDEGHYQGYGDGQGDDQGRAPHEEQGVQNRLLQGADGVLDVLRRVVDGLYLNVLGQGLLYLGQLFLEVLADLHGVGAGLLGHHEADALAAVGLLVEAQVLDLDVLAAHLELVLLLVHLDGTGGKVEVVGGYRTADGLEREAVGIQLLLVDVHVHIALRRAGKGKVSDTVDHAQLRDDLIVEQLVQSRVALVGRNRVLEDRHGGVRLPIPFTMLSCGMISSLSSLSSPG